MSETTITLGPAVESMGRGHARVVPVRAYFRSDGSHVVSQNGKYVLILQKDGNLVLYEVVGEPYPWFKGPTFKVKPIWASGTKGPRNFATLQDDGNFVIFQDNHDTPVWATYTHGTTAVGLFIQDDGILVIYKEAPAWASNTSR